MTVHLRICEFCKGSFMPKTNGWRRGYCFDPECIEKHKEKKKAYFALYRKTYERSKIIAAKSYKEKAKVKARSKKRLCLARLKNCHGFIDNANKFFCSSCHQYVDSKWYAISEDAPHKAS